MGIFQTLSAKYQIRNVSSLHVCRILNEATCAIDVELRVPS